MFRYQTWIIASLCITYTVYVSTVTGERGFCKVAKQGNWQGTRQKPAGSPFLSIMIQMKRAARTQFADKYTTYAFCLNVLKPHNNHLI